MVSDLVLPGRVTPTSLDLPPNLSMQEWAAVGHSLKLMAGAVQFWVGDWFAYGEAHYGEEAWQYLEVTEKTLANWASVCRRVEPSRRREALKFSHHAEVAPLEPEEQERVLEEAASQGWSVSRIREEVQEREKPNAVVVQTRICPTCNGDGRIPEEASE